MSTKLGGYGLEGDNNHVGGSMDVVDTYYTLAAGSITEVKFIPGGLWWGQDLNATFKVFRISGANYQFIGSSQLVNGVGLTSSVVNTVAFDTPVACEDGDLIVFCGLHDNVTVRINTDAGAGRASNYKTGNITSGTSAISGFTTGSGWAPLIEYWGTPASSAQFARPSSDVAGGTFRSIHVTAPFGPRVIA